MADESFLSQKLQERLQSGTLRRLKAAMDAIDFCSNDYLGLARSHAIQKVMDTHHQGEFLSSGSTGSRLLTGNHALFEELEAIIARFHDTETALIFNSGFDANLGLLSALGSRHDIFLYDRLIHASLREGIRLSPAASHAFAHNDPAALKKSLEHAKGRCFVVVESIYSMDGDQAPLSDFAEVCDRYGAYLIVDEAHATGVMGPRGAGLVQQLDLAARCFARVHTFGKALGTHGAAIVGSADLKAYLINFARPLIYSTALPPAALASIAASYELFPRMDGDRDRLHQLVTSFREATLRWEKLSSNTPIQGVVVPGNERVSRLAGALQRCGLDVRPILSPTVPEGTERLRIVLHSFNTEQELQQLTSALQTAEDTL
jgi:8-amino-7-oxononanoate synthase